MKPTPMEAISFSWLTNLFTGAFNPAQIEAAIASALQKFTASINMGQFLTGLWSALAAGNVQSYVVNAAKGAWVFVKAELDALAKSTTTPIDDTVFSALEKMVDDLFASLSVVTPPAPTPTPVHPPLQAMQASPDEEAWNAKFKSMSFDERKAEIHRLVSKTKGESDTNAILTSIFITILVNFAATWGISMLKKFFPGLFPATLSLS